MIPRRERRATWITIVIVGVIAVGVGLAAWWLGGDDDVIGTARTPETWNTWTAADGVVSSCTCSMALAPDGSVWVVAFDGAARFDGTRWSQVNLPRPFAGEGSPNVAIAPDGSVWLSGMSYLARFDAGVWDPIVQAGFGIDEGDPLSFEGLVIDGTGRVWTSLGDQPGIIDDGTFRIADEDVVGIPGYEPSWGIPWSVEPDGAIWFLGEDDVRVDGAEVTRHTLAGGIVDIGPDGSRWMGEYPIVHDDGESLLSYDLGGVRRMAFGDDGSVWFLVNELGPDAWMFGAEQWSEPGLYRLHDGDWRRITIEDGLPGYRLSDMVMSNDGALWIATAVGTVTRYQPGSNPESGTAVSIEVRPLSP